jgi:hypothetical protein
MRHVIASGILAAALIAVRADAQDTPRATPAADPHPAEQARPGEDIKGYGYGEQPGKSDTAAKQEAGRDRQESKAPQDERRGAGRTGAAGSATGAGARAVSGRIVKVEPDSLSVRSADRRVHRLRLDARTRVLRQGTSVSAGTLQPGEEVQASFDTHGGRRVATTITLVESGANEPPHHTDRGVESERRQDGEPSGRSR